MAEYRFKVVFVLGPPRMCVSAGRCEWAPVCVCVTRGGFFALFFLFFLRRPVILKVWFKRLTSEVLFISFPLRSPSCSKRKRVAQLGGYLQSFSCIWLCVANTRNPLKKKLEQAALCSNSSIANQGPFRNVFMHFIHAGWVMCLVAGRRKRMTKTRVSIPPIAPPVSWGFVPRSDNPAAALGGVQACRRLGLLPSGPSPPTTPTVSGAEIRLFFWVQLRALELPLGLGWSCTNQAAAEAAAAAGIACKTES